MDKFDRPDRGGGRLPVARHLSGVERHRERRASRRHLRRAAADRRGRDTTWRVTNLPSTDDVFILCDGEPFRRFSVDGAERDTAGHHDRHAALPDLHRLPGTGSAGRRSPAERPGRGAGASRVRDRPRHDPGPRPAHGTLRAASRRADRPAPAALRRQRPTDAPRTDAERQPRDDHPSCARGRRRATPERPPGFPPGATEPWAPISRP